MELRNSEIDNGIQLLALSGRLDMIGAGEIETKFAGYCSGDHVLMIVDLSGVEFLASIGIRLLTLNARSIVNRGGRMVLLKPRPEVRDVLEMTGIPAIIPIYDNLESAEAVILK